jgi:hypothetical protein
MGRSWFGTVRLLEIEIGVMVAVVVMALLVITARLARDPSEPAVRWLVDRWGTRPAVQHPAEAVAGATVPVPVGSAAAAEQRTATPEWLDRLLGRTPPQEARPAASPQDPSADPESGRRVA